MCAKCCAIGVFEQGGIVSAGRIRVSGTLSRGRRGMILITTADDVWIIEGNDIREDIIGSPVTVEGVVAGMDRIRADWLGVDSQSS
jgi:hypothetical protein